MRCAEPLLPSISPLLTFSSSRLVTLSTRLTTSPCIVTAGVYGYSGNMERLLMAQNAGASGENFMAEFARSQKKVRFTQLYPPCLRPLASAFRNVVVRTDVFPCVLVEPRAQPQAPSHRTPPREG